LFALAIVVLVLAAIGFAVSFFVISPHDPATVDAAHKTVTADREKYGLSKYDVAFPVNARRIATRVSAIVAVFGIIFLGWSTVRSVPVHSVGVETAYGKVEGALRPGLHFGVAPWTKVNVLDETIQTTQFYGDGKNGNCMPVRIGGQQLACLNVTIKWQIEDPAAPVLFNKYDNTGTTVQASIKNNLVVNDLRTVANNVFGDYNPIEDASITAAQGGTATAQSKFSTFGPEILASMRADLRDQISIISINLSNAYYSSATETRLASVANQFADTAQAQQQVSTDTALAQANTALAKSLTQQIVQNNCVTDTTDILKSGGKLPAGWNCFGGSSVAVGP
jgi:regulator of protease activity HflC (stomatin/prohibitin superfamily)